MQSPPQRIDTRNHAWTLALSALLVLCAPALAACGSGGTSSASTSTTNANASSHLLTVGESASLEGERAGEEVEATLLAFKPSLPHAEAPRKGRKVVAVLLKLKNLGTHDYTDSPTNGAVLFSAQGTRGKQAVLLSGECSETFSSRVRIAAGASEQGCIPFELTSSDSAARFQWTPSSGFGHESAVWSLTE